VQEDPSDAHGTRRAARRQAERYALMRGAMRTRGREARKSGAAAAGESMRQMPTPPPD